MPDDERSGPVFPAEEADRSASTSSVPESVPEVVWSEDRLEALHDLEVLGTEPEPAFDRCTRIATGLLGAPVSLVNFVGERRQWLKSRVGFEKQELDLEPSFCTRVIDKGAPLVVEDAAGDERFAETTCVAEHGFRFYTGVPLTVGDGVPPVGTLCVLSEEPQSPTEEQIRQLEDLAALIEDELADRRNEKTAGSKAEHRYQTALEQSPVIFAKVDNDLRYEWIYNPHDDFEPETARGMKDNELDSGSGIEALMNLKRRALEQEQQLREEITFERSEGTQTYDITATPLQEGTSQAVTGLYTAALNITQRKEAERELHATKEQYRTLIDHFPGGVFLYDEDLRCTLAGGEALNEVGLPSNEIEGKRPAERYPPEIAGPLMEGLRAALSGEKSTLQQSYQGRDYYVETLPVRAGEVCMAVSMDVTEQREITRQLREERDRLNRILQTSPVAIVFLDAEGRFVEASSRAEEVLGLSEKELTNRTYKNPEWRIRGPDGEPMPEEQLPFRRVVETGEAVYDLEHHIERPDDTQRLLSVSGAPLRSPDGGLEGAVFHVTDITERRKATKKLQEAKREAEEADRLKTALLSNMNHELRTPLTSIISFAELIDTNPEMAARFTGRILGGAKRLLYTLNTVMEFAELEGTGYSVDPGLCQLRDVVHSAVNSYRERAREKGLEMEVEISATRPVHLDGHLTERILTHLLHNAIKFTEEGQVSVTARTAGEKPERKTEIRVEDTGVGIDPEFLPNVFDEFAQGSTGFDRTHEGNGLGLTITKRLVEHMDGKIAIDSEPEEGTWVTVRLPASK